MRFLLFLVSLICSINIHSAVSSIEHNGQFRLRNDHKQLEHSSSDLHNTFQMRARLKLQLLLDNGTKFIFSPQATKNYGEIISPANDESNSSVNSSGDKYHSSTDIHEAYVTSMKGNIEYKIGRQEIVYGEKVVLGSRNWTAGGQVFDAIKLNHKKLDIVYSHISEGTSRSDHDDDSILAFLYYKYIDNPKSALDFYFIYNNDKLALESSSIGFRVKKKFNSFNFLSENIAQTHVGNDTTEHNINFKLEYPNSKTSKFFIGFSQASENYFQLYANRHLYNGMIDVVGRKNLETYEVGYVNKPADNWNYSINYLAFSQKQAGVGAYNQSTASIISGDSDEKQIGSEVDLTLGYSLDKAEKLTLGYSNFFYGGYFDEDTYGDDLANSSFTYLQYSLKF